MDTIVFFIFVIVLVIVITVLSVTTSKNYPQRGINTPRNDINHFFREPHEPSGEYGENHQDIVDDRVVNHPEPEIGYVVLNGVKRRLEDCKWL